MARFDRTDRPDRLDHGLKFDQPEGPPFPTQPKQRNTMSLFKLDLRSKDVPAKLTLGTSVVTAMTGNDNYPVATRVPTDAQMAAAQAALQTAKDEADAAEITWKEKNAARRTAEDAWAVVVTARANNCESVTPGNVEALTSTGLPMRGAPAPAGALGAPQNVRATAGDMEGEVDVMWDALRGSSSNVVESRPQGGAGAWVQAGIVRQSKLTVTGLTPGAVYEFRVHGIGKNGDGPWR